MNYKEHYTDSFFISLADNITKEAYAVALQMYNTYWGDKYKVNQLTEQKLSIVYAFNMAVCLKESILNSTNHIETIKKEVRSLWHFWGQKGPNEVIWVYQRNIILGILYYLLSFSDGVDAKELECLKECARHIGIFTNEKGMVYMNDFITAVEKKKESLKDSEYDIERDIQTKEVDRHMAQYVFNNIFKANLDMEKIDKAIRPLLTIKSKDGKRMLLENKYWFVVFQWFLEIDFIRKQRTGSKFREWTQYLYGQRGFSTTSQFDEAKRVCKGVPSQWKQFDVPDEFIAIRDKLSVVFNKDKRQEYRIEGKNIVWDVNKKTGITSID